MRRRNCRAPSQITVRASLVKTNRSSERSEKRRGKGKRLETVGAEGEGGGEGGMENGTQTHCARDEWNREIRSAFSKMRSKYRVSGCSSATPLSFSLSRARESARSLTPLRSTVVDAHFHALFTWNARRNDHSFCCTFSGSPIAMTSSRIVLVFTARSRSNFITMASLRKEQRLARHFNTSNKLLEFWNYFAQLAGLSRSFRITSVLGKVFEKRNEI